MDLRLLLKGYIYCNNLGKNSGGKRTRMVKGEIPESVEMKYEKYQLKKNEKVK